MTIDFDDRREAATCDEDLLHLAEDVIRATLLADGISLQVNVGLSLVDNEEIRTINRSFREIDEATDVLSFPMTDYDLRTAKGSDMVGDIDRAMGELVLGDIVISVERAKEQAAEYGHSFRREFGFLIVHGMLHLLGYDHMEDPDAAVMRDMEEKVLGALALSRDA